MQNNINIKQIEDIIINAGIIASEYYNTGFDIEYKKDGSPVSTADLAVNNYIVEKLTEITPHIPIVSEENKNTISKDIGTFWIIDPIDGTAEFINKSGEFTVNIALIENFKASIGFIYLPMYGVLYTGYNGKCYKTIDGKKQDIAFKKPDENPIIIISKRKQDEKDIAPICEKLKINKILKIASSLKFCVLAEGLADIHMRIRPHQTHEWDIAAGHAIVKAAGGNVFNLHDDTELCYNSDNFLNGAYIVKHS